jgi:hypothetical protein
MKKSELLKLAGEFIGGIEDGTDLAQELSSFMWGKQVEEEPAGKRSLTAEDIADELLPIVSKHLKETADLLVYIAERVQNKRATQEARVKAVIDQFHLVLPETMEDEGIDIAAITTALFGAE